MPCTGRPPHAAISCLRNTFTSTSAGARPEKKRALAPRTSQAAPPHRSGSSRVLAIARPLSQLAVLLRPAPARGRCRVQCVPGQATAGNAGSLPHEDTQDTKNGLLQNVSVWPHRRITRHAHPGPHLHPVLFPLLFPQSMWDSNSNGLFSSLLFWRVLQQGNRPPGRKARPRARGARRHGGTGCDARGGAHRVLPERFLECAPTVTSSPDPRTRCSP